MSRVYRLKIFKLILIFAISFALIIGAIFLQGFNKKIYSRIYDSTSIYKNTNFTKEKYLEEVNNYKRYLLQKDDMALTDDNRYSNDEIMHMQDVRNIFQIAKRFALSVLFISMFFILMMDAKNLREFSRFSFLILFVPAILILPALLDFGKFWILFHKLLFRNDLWLMNPNDSLMINLLPQEIFNAIVLNVIFTFLILSIAFITIIYILYRIRRVEK